MADAPQRYHLQPVRSSREWAAYHAIRRDAIFATLLPDQAYDEHDPDEFAPDHFPHLLLRDGEVLGTVRIDLIGKSAAGFRLIGIRPDLQRQGHGAQTCGRSRASSRQNRDRDQRTPKLARLLPCQWVPRGRMGRPRPDPIGPRTGGENGCCDKTSRKSGGAGLPQFQHRVETVTGAANRSPGTPLRGH